MWQRSNGRGCGRPDAGNWRGSPSEQPEGVPGRIKPGPNLPSWGKKGSSAAVALMGLAIAPLLAGCGGAERAVNVPRVIGLDWRQAARTLCAVGLSPAFRATAVTFLATEPPAPLSLQTVRSRIGPPRVTGTRPAVGEVVGAGTQILLTIPLLAGEPLPAAGCRPIFPS
jgi:hypothetical protein